MAWIRTLFFFLFDFSFSLMPLTIEKERCRAKAKAKAKAKAIRTSFLWLRCVLWCGYLFLSFIINWPFFSIFMANGS
jgi:fatty acid desaturase